VELLRKEGIVATASYWNYMFTLNN
jgi:hypothetical protein